jgi:hypothetical protein
MSTDDRIATQNFKVDAEGRIVFFPYGMYGKGRILPDRATVEAVHTAQKQVFTFVLGVAAVLLGAYQVGVGFPWVLGIGVVIGAAACAVSWLRIRALVLHLPISDEPFDFGDSIQNNGRSGLRGHLIASLVFVLGGIFMLLFGKPEDHWVAVAAIAFFGVGFLLFSWQAIARMRRRRPAAEPVLRRNDRGRS